MFAKDHDLLAAENKLEITNRWISRLLALPEEMVQQFTIVIQDLDEDRKDLLEYIERRKRENRRAFARKFFPFIK